MSGGVVAPPGTPAAVSRGCSCVPYDDDGPRDPRWPGWLTVGCPVHEGADPEHPPEPEFPAEG